MNPVNYLLLSVMLNTSSHLFLKKGVVNTVKQPVEASNTVVLKYIMQPAIWAGVLLNGFAAVFWLLALSVSDLSYAFPFLSINYILIPLGAMFLYREKLSRYRIIGIIVICIGLLFIAMG